MSEFQKQLCLSIVNNIEKFIPAKDEASIYFYVYGKPLQNKLTFHEEIELQSLYISKYIHQLVEKF